MNEQGAGAAKESLSSPLRVVRGRRAAAQRSRGGRDDLPGGAPDGPVLPFAKTERGIGEQPADIERPALAGAGDLEPAVHRLRA